MSDTRSLQIHISSADDAKSVIANLNRIKEAYDRANCDSVEFFYAAPVRNEIEPIVTGAIRWCKTFRREVPMGDGNVFFPLPHYNPPAVVKRDENLSTRTVTTSAPQAQAASETKPVVKRRMRRNPNFIPPQTNP